MELNTSFWSGLGCGLCLGLSLIALRKYFGFGKLKAVKQFMSNKEYKVVIVVRTDLNMTKGKIAAQCGHASVGVFRKAQKKDPNGLESWLMSGQTKIALKTDTLEEIQNIASNAKKLGVITSMIMDAGRTQVAPSSVTVLGVGPAPKDVVDKLTGHLKLL